MEVVEVVVVDVLVLLDVIVTDGALGLEGDVTTGKLKEELVAGYPVVTLGRVLKGENKLMAVGRLGGLYGGRGY